MLRYCRLIYLLLVLDVAPAIGQQFLDSLPIRLTPDQVVEDMIKVGDTVFIGGSFQYIGPRTPFIALLDSATAAGFTFQDFPNGNVFAVAPDGHGGWFVGGEFTMVGTQSRNNLAHLDSTGHVTSWNPSPDDEVKTMLIAGNVLYVGGYFNNISSVARKFTAAYSLTTLLLTAWNVPFNYSTTDGVLCSYLKGDTIYFGGTFSYPSVPSTGQHLIGVSRISGAVVHTYLPRPGAAVHALHVFNNTMYISGSFTTLYQTVTSTSFTRTKAAAFSLITNLVSSWNPQPSALFLAIGDDGTDIIVGGGFGLVNSVLHPYLAALDPVTAALTSNPINSLDVARTVRWISREGNVMYFGGEMYRVNGNDISACFAYDVLADTILAWDPGIGSAVWCGVVYNGKVMLGGSFTTSNAVRRNGLAAFRYSDHTLLSFDAQLRCDYQPTYVITMSLADSFLYIGGYFDTIAGVRHASVAKINIHTAQASPWTPDIQSSVAMPLIHDVLVYKDKVYIGGSINQAEGQPRGNFCIYDTSGSLLPQTANFDNYVNTIAVLGSNIVVAGSFNTANSQPREQLALFDIPTFTLQAWNPNPDQSTIGIASDGVRLFVTGFFTVISNEPRVGLAVYDSSSTPQLLDWGTNLFFNNTLSRPFISTSSIYIVGNFTTVQNQPRQKFAAFDPVTGGLQDVQLPCFNSNGSFYFYPMDNRLYISSFSGTVMCFNESYTLTGFDIGRNLIQGEAFIDSDSDGVRDSLELPRMYQQILLQPGNQITCTDSSGQYSFFCDTANFVCQPQLDIYTNAAVPSIHTVPMHTWIVEDTLNDFGIHDIAGVRDLEVMLYPAEAATRGFVSGYVLICRNRGSVIQDGYVTVKLPQYVTLDSTLVAPDYFNGLDTIRWNFTNLIPGEQRNIVFYCSIGLQLTLGDSITFNTQIDTIALDSTPLTNVMSMSQIIVGSHDPNYKSVIPADTLQPLSFNDYLAYTIHFQNTGTSPAINIVIMDTIDSGYDLSTFQFLASSHACTWNISNRVLRIDFPNIMLADSFTSVSLSQGYFIYRIMPVQPVAVLGSVSNSAAIYFDFNDPLITNAATTWFGTITSQSPIGTVDLTSQVYPNPSAGTVVILIQDPDFRGAFELHDVSGKVVASDQLTSGSTTVNFMGVAAGFYTLSLRNSEGEHIAFHRLVITER